MYSIQPTTTYTYNTYAQSHLSHHIKRHFLLLTTLIGHRRRRGRRGRLRSRRLVPSRSETVAEQGARRARRCDRIHPTATWPQLCPQSADHAAVPRTSVRLPKAGGAYMLRPIQTGLNGLPLLNKNANPGQFINLISFNECFFHATIWHI